MNAVLILMSGLVAWAAPPQRASADSATVCLALATGVWTPRKPGAIWRAPRTLSLRSERDSLLSKLSWLEQWRSVRVERTLRRRDSLSTNEYDRGWLWLAPTADSLRLLRPPMLSEGFAVTGRWRGDTLRGRANAFSDAVRFPQPRANAYAVRFACAGPGAAEQALQAVQGLARADVPDRQRAAQEDSAEQARWRRRS